MNKRTLMTFNKLAFLHSLLDNFKKRRMKMITVIVNSAFIRYKNSFTIDHLLNLLSRSCHFTTAVILLIIVSVAGPIRSFSQNGATPMATIPMMSRAAAHFSFHLASARIALLPEIG